MIIDAHIHIPPEAKTYLKRYIQMLDECNVDYAVAMSLGHIPGYGCTNEELYECVSMYPDRLLMFGTVMPTHNDAVQRLEELSEKYKWAGVKFHPGIQGFSITDTRAVMVVKKAAELGLPVLFHTGPATTGELRLVNDVLLDDLANLVPEATIIMAHGFMTQIGPFIAKRGFRSKERASVYIDTSCPQPRLPPFNWDSQAISEDVVRYIGADRVIFGTDALFRDEHFVMKGWGSYPEFLNKCIKIIRNLKLSGEEKDKILGGNAKELLGL